MDHRGQPMYQNPKMAMMNQAYIDSVPGSIPINQMGNIPQEAMVMSDNHANFVHKMYLNKMPVQENYSQLPIRKEVDHEGRICGVVLPETAQQHNDGNSQRHNERNISGHELAPQQIKTEEDDIMYFMKSAHEILVKIHNKELKIKEAADLVGRRYSFVYRRYQDYVNKLEKEAWENDPNNAQKIKKRISRLESAMKVKKLKKKKRGRKKVNWGGPKSKSERPEKRFKCDMCPGIYYTDHQIKAHEKLHEEGADSHTCTVCGIVFAKLFHLMRHRIADHEEALQCPHCDHTFTVISSYRAHVRNHTGEKPFVCKECGKCYAAKLHLEHHIRTHTGERPYMCGYCEKTFITLGNLKGHQRIHTDTPEQRKYKKHKKGYKRIKEKVFSCDQCGKCYDSQSNLDQHINTHTDARPYACDECDARFNFKSGLNYHKMTHKGIEPYKCDLCPLGFYKKISLDQHKVMHTGVKPFKCDLCDYSCTRKETLEYHKYTHTGETPFKCDFYGCTAAYAKPGSLRHHKLQHGQPPKTCKYCHEKFQDHASLKRHMMIHTGEKPVSCEQCGKTFLDKGSLKRHMYSHMYKHPGTKTKQVRQPRKNTGTKKADKAVIPQKWESEYQVPNVSENGLSIFVPSLAAPAQTTNNQPAYHHFTASQYSSMANNAWPSSINPDELRQRLLSSFK